MAKNPTKADKHNALLQKVHEGTQSQTGYTFVSEADAKPLVDAGHIEMNPNVRNDQGHLAARTTQAGHDHLAANVQTTPPFVAPTEVAVFTGNVAGHGGGEPVVSKYKIDHDVPMPEAKRGRQGTLYPFEHLQVGHSFHVPATPEKDAAATAKGLASTVSSANGRYAKLDPSGVTRPNRKGELVPATIAERKFEVRPVDASDRHGHGARVFRTL